MAIRFAYCYRIEKIPFDYDKMKGANKEQSPLTSVNRNTASLAVDPTLVKQFEYDLKIAKVSDIKDSANIKQYAKKLAILPIELGNLLQLKKLHDYPLNDDYNNVLLQIPIIRIQRAVPAEMITTHLLRDVKDLQIDIKFLDENENTQSMMLNVEDRYVNVICKKIDELKRVDNPRYWLRRDIPYKLGESTITVIIFPQTPFLAENEVVLWSNKKLNEITNKTIVKLQALTNFRIFEYEFEMHEGHYLVISDIEDIILTNKRWISHKNNDKGCIETTIVGDLTFINQGKQCITFSEINDPDSLTRLLKAARLMSQNPTKRNKDTKEVSEENIEKPIDSEDPTIGESAEEEETGQRDTKSADAADSAESMIV